MLKPIANITYHDVLHKTEGFQIDHSTFNLEVKNILNDLGDYLCAIAKKIKNKNEITYMISGVFGALRYRLKELSEKVA